MKATGIVRRIDDLGRVVIPKEIRRTLRIREGDPLEIFTDRDGSVVFRKYSPVGEIADFAGQYTDVLYKMTGMPSVICDSDRVVAVSGIPRKEAMEKQLTPQMEELLRARRSLAGKVGEEAVQPAEGMERRAAAMYPIVATGDVMGAVMLLQSDPPRREAGEENARLAQAAALFLGRQIEE